MYKTHRQHVTSIPDYRFETWDAMDFIGTPRFESNSPRSWTLMRHWPFDGLVRELIIPTHESLGVRVDLQPRFLFCFFLFENLCCQVPVAIYQDNKCVFVQRHYPVITLAKFDIAGFLLPISETASQVRQRILSRRSVWGVRWNFRRIVARLPAIVVVGEQQCYTTPFRDVLYQGTVCWPCLRNIIYNNALQGVLFLLWGKPHTLQLEIRETPMLRTIVMKQIRLPP